MSADRGARVCTVADAAALGGLRPQLKRGATRTVLLLGPLALKWPRTSHWPAFLRGLLANIQEVSFSRLGSPLLCPVVVSLPLGFALIMRRAEVLDPFVYVGLDTAWLDGFSEIVEMKIDSFGQLAGRVVAVDYGS